MTISLQVNQISPGRQARLKAWLALNGVRQSDLARHLGVSRQMLNKIVLGQAAPASRIARLVELGVPRDLLPEPTDGKRGPKGNGAGLVHV